MSILFPVHGVKAPRQVKCARNKACAPRALGKEQAISIALSVPLHMKSSTLPASAPRNSTAKSPTVSGLSHLYCRIVAIVEGDWMWNRRTVDHKTFLYSFSALSLRLGRNTRNTKFTRFNDTFNGLHI